MLTNRELTREDIDIDPNMEVDDDIRQEILAYVETWFDVDQKFHVDTSAEDTWLNMYARWNPYVDTLFIDCEISSDKDSDSFAYEPTARESAVIKELIAQKISETFSQTPQEFCEDFYGDSPNMIGIS